MVRIVLLSLPLALVHYVFCLYLLLNHKNFKEIYYTKDHLDNCHALLYDDADEEYRQGHPGVNMKD